MKKSIPLNQSPLFRLRNRTKLAELIGLPKNLFRKSINFDDQYIDFSKPKKHGDGLRYFSTPKGKEIALIQERLFCLLDRIERPYWVKSGQKGESYITNADAHKLNKYGMKTDISSFYESVSFSKIRDCFLDKFQMSSDLAEIMTKLVTHNRKIPTGGAASMLVAYYAYEDMFDKIHTYAEQNGITFTLYVDDLSFSSSRPITAEHFSIIRSIIQSYGLHTKWQKTNFYTKGKYREYTGVGINSKGKLIVPNHMREDIINTYKDCRVDGTNMKKLERLQGKVNAANQIEQGIFPQIRLYLLEKSKELKKYRRERNQDHIE